MIIVTFKLCLNFIHFEIRLRSLFDVTRVLSFGWLQFRTVTSNNALIMYVPAEYHHIRKLIGVIIITIYHQSPGITERSF